MGRVFLVELDDKAYRCKFCDTPIALADDILSRMIAPEKNQKYKEGKSVLERVEAGYGAARVMLRTAAPGSGAIDNDGGVVNAIGEVIINSTTPEPPLWQFRLQSMRQSSNLIINKNTIKVYQKVNRLRLS
ncbi:hypothetical protein KSS87_004921 [Heliosperma pusillum]|nr:hypothetical protein KSS87_004921 [Heliosperma pusillum]